MSTTAPPAMSLEDSSTFSIRYYCIYCHQDATWKCSDCAGVRCCKLHQADHQAKYHSIQDPQKMIGGPQAVFAIVFYPDQPRPQQRFVDVGFDGQWPIPLVSNYFHGKQPVRLRLTPFDPDGQRMEVWHSNTASGHVNSPNRAIKSLVPDCTWYGVVVVFRLSGQVYTDASWSDIPAVTQYFTDCARKLLPLYAFQ